VTAVAPLHVERTNDPVVLRWVTHDSTLVDGDRFPDTTSAMAALLQHIAGIAVRNGDVLVRIDDANDWPKLAGSVNDALLVDLSHGAPWLTAPTTTASRQPSRAAVQQTVNDAAGDVLAAHGGRIEVVNIEGPTAVVRLHGACNGCAGANTTVQSIVRTAVLAAHPTLTDVTEAVAAPSRVSLLARKPIRA
jgi:NFU1 iron-sulfur cluster scaffold homolog, mitochondrial